MLVAKLNWLLPLDPLTRIPARTSDLHGYEQRCDQNKDRTEDRGARQIIRTVTEDLRHSGLNKTACFEGGLLGANVASWRESRRYPYKPD